MMRSRLDETPMIDILIEKMRGWLPRRSGNGKPARERPGEIGMEFDIVRGVAHRTRGRPFVAVKPDSARCIPSRGRKD
jgi:hypothetical protein